MSIYQPIFMNKKIKGSMGHGYSYALLWENSIVVVLYINGSLASFLLLCNHGDTESGSWQMEIGVFGPILTNKKHQRLFWTMISILYMIGVKWYGNSFYLLNFYHVQIFCNHQDIEYKSWEMAIAVAIPIFNQKYQRLYGTTICIPQNMGGNIVASLHIYGARVIFLLFYDHQDTESE